MPILYDKTDNAYARIEHWYYRDTRIELMRALAECDDLRLRNKIARNQLLRLMHNIEVEPTDHDVRDIVEILHSIAAHLEPTAPVNS